MSRTGCFRRSRADSGHGLTGGRLGPARSPVGRLGGDAQALDRGPKRHPVSQGRRLTGRRDLARELGAALAPHGVQVDRLRRPPAGFARHTFLVGPAEAPVVVKLAPREHRSELVERLRVLSTVRPRDLAVPRPLRMDPFELSSGMPGGLVPHWDNEQSA